ncbi:hypothetical protein [Roseobacter sp. N2S]|uniref:hypothetical protein n=1 Tax=Roseobacter sp. N2S TaxID=2663844 RepID=UPI00285CA2CB|nr:hypothetical protein [Roseobacter sp. N2S]MDR6267639.1 Ca2+-binding RTX toxin-like protein [Roseobacter sp. N2S]
MARNKTTPPAAPFNPDDTFVFDSGTEDYLKLSGGDKSVTLNGTARIDSLKANGDGGIMEATLNGSARVSYMNVSSFDLDLVMNDSSRVRVLQYYDGEANITTGGGYVAYIETWQSTNVITTGSGSVGTIDMGSDTGEYTHKVTTNGWVGTIRVNSDAVILKTGDSGVGTISLGDNRDVVVTGAGYVRMVDTGGGNDKITTSSGGVDFVRAGDGNDTIITGGGVNYIKAGEGNDKVKLFAEAGFNWAIFANGGNGVDLMDLSKAKTGVEYELDNSFHFVESVGYLLAQNFENLKGSKHNDDLTGNDQDNQLIGGRGNDRLEGLSGDDLLIGGGGKDTFVFGYDGGTDRVKGYSKKQDSIEIEGHSGGFKALDISTSGRNKVIEHDNGTIILLGHDGTNLTANQFDFI